MDKKALAEALAGMNAAELETLAPHIAVDMKAQAVEAYKKEHPVSSDTTESKDKPGPKDGTKDDKDAKIAELEKKTADFEKKEREGKMLELIDAEVQKFLPKFQSVARSLIESHVKAAGEIEDTEKAIAEAVKATEKTFEASKLGEVKGAPASAATELGKTGASPFAHAGYGSE